ncbi:PREDICTED: uncharacterized protein LOC109592004 [Amphimedon queenslandica]|uniref:Uncharacterized protein n=1 Tax=Amphimedon queenslandica TaxID=400682 RepID=A0AAN0K1V2_AMPQE|nr:PREDICTED: uncharacterized protein LOC109592004 [Amphimedon queenslandica]|eukprot:XP_019863142.1 PREDICTED: uncharacterized protein LOC109592004 [Amphimedon queenslandica]
MVDSPTTSYGLLFIAYVTAETWLGPAAALVQDITLPGMRAQASAVYIGIISIVASIGPVLVPLFSDHVPAFSDCLGLRYALLCTVPTFYFISALIFGSLGLVMKYWAQKHKNKSGSYAIFTDAIATSNDNGKTT